MEQIVGCLGVDQSSIVASQQQTFGSSALSVTCCEVAYNLIRGVQTQVSTLCGTRDLLLLQPLTYNPTTYGIQTLNLTIYFAVYQNYVLRMLLNNYPVNIARLLNYSKILCNLTIHS